MKHLYGMKVYPVETTEGIEYIARYNEIEGCGGSGKTPSEAIQDLEKNIDFHLEGYKEDGDSIPKANNYDVSAYSGKLSLRMSKVQHRDITLLAKENDVSVNSIINDAIAFYIGKETFDKSNESYNHSKDKTLYINEK